MSREFHFDGYTVRPVRESDRAFLSELIEADPYHRGVMTADWFLKPMPGEDAWALEDERGEVVFYFKTSTAVRLAIQFRPVVSPRDRARNRRALVRGLRWFEGMVKGNLFREIITETEGPELRAFTKRHLGFKEASLLSRWLNGTWTPPRTPPEALGTLPTAMAERVE